MLIGVQMNQGIEPKAGNQTCTRVHDSNGEKGLGKLTSSESGRSATLDRLPTWVFTAMLLAASIIWGACFVSVKIVTDVISPSTLIGIRFIGAAVCMFIAFFPRIRRYWNMPHIRLGALLGLLYFLTYWFQVVGLTGTTPSKNAFILGAAVVLVPFAYWALARKRPSAINVGMALLCTVGLALVTLSGDLTLQYGDAISLGCMFFYAIHIACVSIFVKDRDIFTITFVQFAICGILALLVGFVTEQQPSLSQLINPFMLAQLAFLIVVGAFLAPLFQNLGQMRVPATQTAIILSLQSVFGTLFSVALYGEVLTLKVLLGFVVIFAAVVLSEVISAKNKGAIDG